MARVAARGLAHPVLGYGMAHCGTCLPGYGMARACLLQAWEAPTITFRESIQGTIRRIAS